MNKDNAKQFLPLVQALADGKTIQILDYGQWRDFLKEIAFSCPPEDYRIKPEPIEMDVWYAGSDYSKSVTEQDMSEYGDSWIKCRAILHPY